MAVDGTEQRVEDDGDAGHEDAGVAAAELPVGGVNDAHLAHPETAVIDADQQNTSWAFTKQQSQLTTTPEGFTSWVPRPTGLQEEEVSTR